MNAKHRLSSKQALDDYFFDLLIESEELESAEEPHPQNNSDKDGGRETSSEAVVPDEATDDTTIEKPAETEPDLRSDDENDGDECAESVVDDVAVPFDFEQLSESDDEPVEATIAVELNLSSPVSKASSWVPLAQEVPLETVQIETMPLEAERVEVMQVKAVASASFVEQPRSELEGVQRLLSQMSKMQSEIRQESDALIAVQTEADFLAASYQEGEQESPQIVTEVVAESVVPTVEETVLAESLVQLDPALPEPELEQPEPDVHVTPETQSGGDEPPDLWQQQQEMDEEFQALFFEVNGVTFAVPLTELGGSIS